MKMLRMPIICAAAAIAAVAVCVAGRAGAQDLSAVDILAAQVRIQGFQCGKPLSAARSPAASRPDEPLWRLTCDNAAYDVRLVPDMAARITLIPR